MLKLVDVQFPAKGFCDSSSSQAKTKNKRESKKEKRLRLHSSDEILGINGHLMPSNDVVGDQ